MYSYWLVLSLYVLSGVISLVALIAMLSSGKYKVQMNPSFNWSYILLGFLSGWLIYTVFENDFNDIAILFSIIWVSRWISATITSVHGWTITLGSHFISFLVSLFQIVLLLVYHYNK